MAKGDVVNGYLAAAYFQPAAGIEVCITQVTNSNANATADWRLADGVNDGLFAQCEAGSGSLAESGNVKVFLNNTVYLFGHITGFYSGVQVK